MKELVNLEESQKNNEHSEKSFRYFLYSVTAFLIVFVGAAINLVDLVPRLFSDWLFGVSGLMMLVFAIKGLINAIKSIVKREDYSSIPNCFRSVSPCKVAKPFP